MEVGDRMNEITPEWTERLRKLAEFRYQMRGFLSFSESAAEVAGISAQQYQLMQVIAAMPEGKGASISYLAERMILRHNSAVELVDRAVRAGLVKRTTDDEDLRRSIVVMTPEGVTLMKRLVDEHLAEIERRGAGITAALEDVLRSGKSSEKA